MRVLQLVNQRTVAKPDQGRLLPEYTRMRGEPPKRGNARHPRCVGAGLAGLRHWLLPRKLYSRCSHHLLRKLGVLLVGLFSLVKAGLHFLLRLAHSGPGGVGA